MSINSKVWIQSFVMGEEEYATECRQLMDECDLIIIFNHNDTESSAHFRVCDENILSQELINYYTEQGYVLKHDGVILTYLHLIKSLIEYIFYIFLWCELFFFYYLKNIRKEHLCLCVFSFLSCSIS